MLMIAAAGVAGLGIAAMGGWYWFTHSVETPNYTVVERDGPIERRDYPTMVVAEVATGGGRRDGLRDGFRALAGYIFARDRSGESIAMTAPVIQQPTDGAWKVRFVMPSEHAIDDLPRPANARVDLTQWPATRVAAIRFSGAASDADFARHEQDLRTWIDAKGLKSKAGPFLAYYDDPWTPGFLRRNEVLFHLADD